MNALFYKRLVVVLLVMFSAVACDKPVDPVFPNDRGRKIADLSQLSTILGWSADSRELYYLNNIQVTTVDKSSSHLYALDVQTGASRLIYDGPGGRSLFPAGSQRNFQSPDGQYLYLLTQGRRQAGYSLYRIDAHQTNQAVFIDSSSNARYTSLPALSANGNWLSFQYRPDSIRLHNLTNHSFINIRSATGRVTFSPDARQILLRQENSPLYRIVNLSDLSEVSVDIRVPANQLSSQYSSPYPDSDIYWHPEGIRFTYGDFFGTAPANAAIHLYLWNVTQQKKTLLWTVPEEDSGLDREMLSQDGKWVAFTSAKSSYVTRSGIIYSTVFYVTDLTTLKTRKVTTITFTKEENGIRGMFLSPDNTSLAYYIGTQVYVVPIQP